MSKEFNGKIFLTERELRLIIGALELAGKKRFEHLSNCPFGLIDVIKTADPEVNLINKLTNHLKSIKG